jgi:cell division protease FtsH
MSGADLANLVNEAALLAARRDHDKVYMEDLEDAKDKVMLGASGAAWCCPRTSGS